MRLARTLSSVAAVALFIGPALAQQAAPRQDSEKAQKELPAVGGKAASKGDDTTSAMKQQSSKAQKEMPAVGKKATKDKAGVQH